ncbi:MAG: divergent polysaccharide deacetylase family protein [Candidatus Omnitrophota bacterium]
MLIILLAGAYCYSRSSFDDGKRLRNLDKGISSIFNEYQVKESRPVISKEYVVTDLFDIDKFNKSLRELISRCGLKLLGDDIRYEGRRSSRTFSIGTDDASLYSLRLTGIKIPPMSGKNEPDKKKIITDKADLKKVAIVLDDWGYNMNNIAILDSIEIPLTISVLPNLRYSYKIAHTQNPRGNREVILHMPMEPESDDVSLEKNTLMVSMGKREVSDIFDTALKTVPSANGISNHMGSKATKDSRLIKMVMDEMVVKDLYFLDSLATPDTVCEIEARKAGVRFAKRDIFLDNKSDKAYIVSQLNKLMAVASKNGYAIGIGHDRRLTLDALKDLSMNPPRGIKFVLLSELVKR